MKSAVLEFHFRKNISVRELRAEGRLEFSSGRWIHSLMGASGVGKSSLARWILGLDEAEGSWLKWNDQTWADSARRVSVKPQARRIGWLAQGDRLFPHLNVSQNITYGLRKWDPARREERLKKMLLLTGLTDLSQRMPTLLSGGEKRRVALAQALAVEPQLLILDEPFAGLDLEAKQDLWRETRDWIERAELPTLLITHDAAEAAAFTLLVHRYVDGALQI